MWVTELYFSNLSTRGKCWRTWLSYANFCELVLSNIPWQTAGSMKFRFCASTTPRDLPLSLRITVYRTQLTKDTELERLARVLRRHSWRKLDSKTHTGWVKQTPVMNFVTGTFFWLDIEISANLTILTVPYVACNLNIGKVNVISWLFACFTTFVQVLRLWPSQRGDIWSKHCSHPNIGRDIVIGWLFVSFTTFLTVEFIALGTWKWLK